jgi:hypothetical protein
MNHPLTLTALSAVFALSTGTAFAATDPAVNADPHGKSKPTATSKDAKNTPKPSTAPSTVRTDPEAKELQGQGDTGNAGMGEDRAVVPPSGRADELDKPRGQGDRGNAGMGDDAARVEPGSKADRPNGRS